MTNPRCCPEKNTGVQTAEVQKIKIKRTWSGARSGPQDKVPGVCVRMRDTAGRAPAGEPGAARTHLSATHASLSCPGSRSPRRSCPPGRPARRTCRRSHSSSLRGQQQAVSGLDGRNAAALVTLSQHATHQEAHGLRHTRTHPLSHTSDTGPPAVRGHLCHDSRMKLHSHLGNTI